MRMGNPGARFSIRVAISLSAGILSGCIFDSPAIDRRINFNLDNYLLTCSRVQIQQINSGGTPVSTLFDQRLVSLGQAANLKAPAYDGSSGNFDIKGFKGSELAYNVVVRYSGSSATVEKKTVFTFTLRNYSGTTLSTEVKADGYSLSKELQTGYNSEVGFHFRPDRISYSASTTFGHSYTWNATVTPPATGSASASNLLANANSFQLKVTNNSNYGVGKVIVNAGLASEETVSVYVPPDGVTYILGLFPAFTNTAVRFISLAETTEWDFEGITYGTSSDYGFRYSSFTLLP